jgi:hypothetical protein
VYFLNSYVMLGAAIFIWQTKEFRPLHENLDFGRTVSAKVIRHTYNEMTYVGVSKSSQTGPID